MPRIACIGECMVELSDLDAGDGRVALGFAGDTFNTAVYLARLTAGAARVAYLTALGTDRLSTRMLDAMATEGVETDHVARLPDRLPGIYAIELDDSGERRFRYWRAQSAARAMFGPGGLELTALDGFDMLYLSGITLAILPAPNRAALIGACARAKASGRQVVFDGNYRPALWPDADTARAALSATMAAATLTLPSRDDEAALWPGEGPAEALRRHAAAGVAEVALKDGAGGPHLWAGGGPLSRRDYPPATQVVDTTAAGDSFNAGYLGARLAGRDPAQAAAAGHALARHVIGHHGAIVPMPTGA